MVRLVLCIAQADSSRGIRREPKLHPGLLRGFEAVCENFTAERPIALSLEPSSPGPKQQDSDCLFYTIHNQVETVTVVSPQTDDAVCRMNAGLLRFYAHALAVQDLIDSGSTKCDVDALFRQWMKETKGAAKPGLADTNCVFGDQQKERQPVHDSVSDENAAVLMHLGLQCPYDKEIFRLTV
jgi:hypothetical protein